MSTPGMCREGLGAWAEGRQTPERHLSLEGIAALGGMLGGCCFLKGRHFLSLHTAPGAELLVGGEDEVSGGFLRSQESREVSELHNLNINVAQMLE